MADKNKNASMKFVIVSPPQGDGGPIALHALCKYLCDLGHDARILYTSYFGCGNKKLISKVNYHLKWFRYILTMKHPTYEPVKGCKETKNPFIGKNTIVVYPEIMIGNPFGAKKVVRWLLYNHKYPENVCGAYSENDLFIAFRDVFNDKTLNPDGHIVKTVYFDLDMYKRYNFGERKGTCYIIRKGVIRTDLPQNFDGIVIDKLPEEEKVKVLNECEYCISYDTQSAYSFIAAMCGCISIIVPEEGKEQKDYRTSEDKNFGVAWGFSEEEIQRAIQTQYKVREHYLEMNNKSRESAKRFVEICENYFNK